MYRIARGDCESARGRTARSRVYLRLRGFLRESGQERRKGKLYSVGCWQKKKSDTTRYTKSSEGVHRGDGRVHARSFFMLRVVDFVVDQIPTAAQNRDQRRINGGRIVLDLWPLILCPDSGIAPSSRHRYRRRPYISHPFEKPRADVHSSSKTHRGSRTKAS